LGRLTPKRVPEKKSKKVTNSHRKDMSPLTQGLNYRSACDTFHFVPCTHLTLNCCLFSMYAHIVVRATLLLLLQLSNSLPLAIHSSVSIRSFRQSLTTCSSNLAFRHPLSYSTQCGNVVTNLFTYLFVVYLQCCDSFGCATG